MNEDANLIETCQEHIVVLSSEENELKHKILAAAAEHGGVIHPRRDLDKWVKTHKDMCACAPDRTCPCNELPHELASEDNTCLCRLIVGKKYLKEWGYLQSK